MPIVNEFLAKFSAINVHLALTDHNLNLVDDRIDMDVLSFVSDLEMEGYCCNVSGRFDEEPLFNGVLVPSLPFDCC